MKSEEPKRELAKCGDFDVYIDDHGWLLVSGDFHYEGSSVQGFPTYFADPSIIMRIIRAIGVDSFNQIKGKSCWVSHTWDEITKIEPLHKKDGEAFDIVVWKKWAKERMPKISPYEYMTGKKP
jgi:hypothetical protein